MMGVSCMDETCELPLKPKSLMTCHILTKNSLKTFGWQWQQVIAQEESRPEGTKKTDEHGQKMKPGVTTIEYSWYEHNLGTNVGN